MLNLIRSNGKIVNANTGSPVVLVGGQYYLFKADGLGERALVNAQGNVILREAVNSGDEVCPPGQPFQGAKYSYWVTWNALFNQMVSNRCNLLRIFLSNGTAMRAGAPTDLFPFNRTAAGKLNVRAAVEAPPGAEGFNKRFFDILKDFALHADERDITLQICLFNHFDLVDNQGDPFYQGWEQSFWNPAATNDPAWGQANLVNVPGGDRHSRNRYFMDTTKAGLMNAQRKFVERVVKAVHGRGNVIFEVMNEPRGTLRNEGIAVWYSKVVGWVLQAAGAWRPLISVNASKHALDAPDFDVDAWKRIVPRDPNYDAVDLISYHGLTGYPGASISTCGAAEVAPVDKDSINARVTEHQTNHAGKALIFSTDGVHHFSHSFANVLAQTDASLPPVIEMHKRDGQITTKLPNLTTADANTQRRLSDLNNWAYWCLARALKPAAAQGTLHFQNISSYLASFQSINAARSELGV